MFRSYLVRCISGKYENQEMIQICQKDDGVSLFSSYPLKEEEMALR